MLEVIQEYHTNSSILESNIAVLIILRQIAEYVDGASILIENNNSDSLVPILRTIIELSIGAEYILDKDFEQRSKKLLFYYYQKTKEQFENSLPSKGSRVLDALKKDKYVSDDTIKEFQSGSKLEQEIINQIDGLLSHPLYTELRSYYSENKSAIKNWFSLLDGPVNFEQLCSYLNKNSVYEISYRRWTSYTHAWNVVNNNLEFLDNGDIKIVGSKKGFELRDRVLELIRFSRSPLLHFLDKRSTPEQKKTFAIWLMEFNNKYTTIFPELL